MATIHLGLMIIALAVTAVRSQPQIAITTAVTEVTPGNTFTIGCDASGIETGAFIRIMKYFQEDPKPVVFSTNTILQDDFKDGRFSIDFSLGEAGALNFLFNVSDARPEDSGLYSCAIYGGEGILAEDKKPITVISNKDLSLTVTLVRMSTRDEYVYKTSEEETHDFTLEDSEDFDITIKTSATYPAPELKLAVGSRDITAQLQMVTDSEVFSGDSGLQGVEIALTAMGTIRVDHSFSRGLTVTLVAPGGLEVTETVVFKFEGYPPTMDPACANLLLAGDHDKDVVYNCTFMASEEPEVYIYYNRALTNGEFEKVVLNPGEYNTHYEVDVNTNGHEKYVALLNMGIVYPQMFRSHYLVVTTAKGNFTHEFVIERDPSKEIDASASSQLLVSIATVLMCLVAAIFPSS